MNLPMKVSGELIEDFAVLREGVHYGPYSGWGWTKISITHGSQIKKLLG